MTRFLLPLLWCGLISGPPAAAAEPSPAAPLPAKGSLHLYLLIGQSNMAGRGVVEDQDRQPHPRVLTFTKESKWAQAVDPIHFDKSIAGVGLGTTFGREMAEANPGVTIGLVPCAVGGTPLERWQKGKDLYEQAMVRIKAAMKDGTLKGVLWHQGEGDSADPEKAKSYAARLAVMVGDLRKDLGAPDVPFVAGKLGEFLADTTRDGKPSHWKTVNVQIAGVPALVKHAAVVESTGLKHKGDVVHFDSASLREFGRRYAQAMQRLQKDGSPVKAGSNGNVKAAPTLPGESSRMAAVRQALDRSIAYMRSISTEGGYVYLYSLDLQKRTAERPATPTQIAIQPPGTPSMGQAFLRIHRATGAAAHLDAARDAAMALVKCQLPSGGWHNTADFDPARPNVDGALYGGEKYSHSQIILHKRFTTFDDTITQSAVGFLLEYAHATTNSTDPRDENIRGCLERALQCMLKAQYPNGGWPQRYGGETRDPANHPVRKAQVPASYPRKWPDADYTRFYTLNDNCQSDCIQVMLKAWRLRGDAKFLDAAKRGADFLLLAQLPEPQPAWAQQYNFSMEPAWARVHESPSVSSCESGNAIHALLEVHLETGDKRYLESAGTAVAWLRRSTIGKNQWARLYELGTNRPVYGDDRGEVRYSQEELSRKFATGYSWKSDFNIPKALTRYDRIRSGGAAPAPARVAATMTAKDLRQLEARVDEIVTSLDDAGRWISKERWRKGAEPEPVVATRTFIKNTGILAGYLEKGPPAQRDANAKTAGTN